MTGVFGIESGYHAIQHCDLLLLGCDFAWRQFYSKIAKVVRIDLDPSHLGRRHPVDVAAVGDIGPTIDALLPLLEQEQDRRFLDEAVALRARATEQLDERAVAGKHDRIHPQYLTRLIARHAQDNAVWTADAGTPTVWLLRQVPAPARTAP